MYETKRGDAISAGFHTTMAPLEKGLSGGAAASRITYSISPKIGGKGVDIL